MHVEYTGVAYFQSDILFQMLSPAVLQSEMSLA